MKKKSKTILIIIISVFVVGIAACVIFLNDTIPGIRSTSFGISNGWARSYFNELKEGNYKKDISSIEKATAKKVYFVGHDIDKNPVMVLNYEINSKNYYILFYIDYDGKVNYLNYDKSDFKFYYDSLNRQFDFFYIWYYADSKFYEYDAIRNYTNRTHSTKFRYYDNGTFLVYESEYHANEKYTNKKVNEYLVLVDIEPTSFDYSFDDEDYIIKRKIKDAEKEYKDVEDLVNHDKMNDYDNIIEANKKKADEERKKASSKTTSSSTSTTSKKSCKSENPCVCIERKKCPSGWTLICSMEWCEKKITNVSKANCNDSLAKKYGTPAKGATSWSDYTKACHVMIEAKK